VSSQIHEIPWEYGDNIFRRNNLVDILKRIHKNYYSKDDTKENVKREGSANESISVKNYD